MASHRSGRKPRMPGATRTARLSVTVGTRLGMTRAQAAQAVMAVCRAAVVVVMEQGVSEYGWIDEVNAAAAAIYVKETDKPLPGSQIIPLEGGESLIVPPPVPSFPRATDYPALFAHADVTSDVIRHRDGTRRHAHYPESPSECTYMCDPPDMIP